MLDEFDVFTGFELLVEVCTELVDVGAVFGNEVGSDGPIFVVVFNELGSDGAVVAAELVEVGTELVEVGAELVEVGTEVGGELVEVGDVVVTEFGVVGTTELGATELDVIWLGKDCSDFANVLVC